MNEKAGTDGDSAKGGTWRNVLRHPLVVGATLAVLSGVLASLLIPSLTRVWQDRPQELALKRSLVERTSRLTTETFAEGDRLAGLVTSIGDPIVRRRKLLAISDRVQRRWVLNSAVIESDLNTYFHKTSLPRQWRDFSDAMPWWLTNSYARWGAKYSDDLVFSLSLLRDHFRSVSFSGLLENVRRGFVNPHGPRPFEDPSFIADELMQEERDQIEDRIVETGASGFSHGFWIFR